MDNITQGDRKNVSGNQNQQLSGFQQNYGNYSNLQGNGMVNHQQISQNYNINPNNHVSSPNQSIVNSQGYQQQPFQQANIYQNHLQNQQQMTSPNIHLNQNISQMSHQSSQSSKHQSIDTMSQSLKSTNRSILLDNSFNYNQVPQQQTNPGIQNFPQNTPQQNQILQSQYAVNQQNMTSQFNQFQPQIGQNQQINQFSQIDQNSVSQQNVSGALSNHSGLQSQQLQQNQVPLSQQQLSPNMMQTGVQNQQFQQQQDSQIDRTQTEKLKQEYVLSLIKNDNKMSEVFYNMIQKLQSENQVANQVHPSTHAQPQYLQQSSTQNNNVQILQQQPQTSVQGDKQFQNRSPQRQNQQTNSVMIQQSSISNDLQQQDHRQGKAEQVKNQSQRNISPKSNQSSYNQSLHELNTRINYLESGYSHGNKSIFSSSSNSLSRVGQQSHSKARRENRIINQQINTINLQNQKTACNDHDNKSISSQIEEQNSNQPKLSKNAKKLQNRQIQAIEDSQGDIKKLEYLSKLSNNQMKKLLNKQYPNGKNTKPMFNMNQQFYKPQPDQIPSDNKPNIESNDTKTIANTNTQVGGNTINVINYVINQQLPNQKQTDLQKNDQKQLDQSDSQSAKVKPEKKNQAQKYNKRDKIFISIYSSYLQVNMSVSPNRKNENQQNTLNESNNASDGERELTPMARQPFKSKQTIKYLEDPQVNNQSINMQNVNSQASQNSNTQLSIENLNSRQQGRSQIIKYLDLNRFKSEKCKNLQNGRQHNHKHCRYYHTMKDQRRINQYEQIQQILKFGFYNNLNGGTGDDLWKVIMNSLYQSDLCRHYETENCEKRESCQLSHNRVESVYHPDKYKAKYCSKYPKNLSKCEYGDYCSFAHSTKELKTRLIHQMKKDEDFFMFYFKTEWCPFNKEHNKAQCVYAHNWQDFRRKPNIYDYDSKQICSNWKPDTFIEKYFEGCQNQASCSQSHGWKEQDYHPLTYKTQPCQEGKEINSMHSDEGSSYHKSRHGASQHTNKSSQKCLRGLECPYYHSQKEKREPKLVNQRLDRPDFQYDKILEMSMNLNNINQLQELLLIKINEMQYSQNVKKQKVSYFEQKITDQQKSDLVSKGVFRDITLYSLIARKVLLVEKHFDKYQQQALALKNGTKDKKIKPDKKIDKIDKKDDSHAPIASQDEQNRVQVTQPQVANTNPQPPTQEQHQQHQQQQHHNSKQNQPSENTQTSQQLTNQQIMNQMKQLSINNNQQQSQNQQIPIMNPQYQQQQKLMNNQQHQQTTGGMNQMQYQQSTMPNTNNNQQFNQYQYQQQLQYPNNQQNTQQYQYMINANLQQQMFMHQQQIQQQQMHMDNWNSNNIGPYNLQFPNNNYNNIDYSNNQDHQQNQNQQQLYNQLYQLNYQQQSQLLTQNALNIDQSTHNQVNLNEQHQMQQQIPGDVNKYMGNKVTLSVSEKEYSFANQNNLGGMSVTDNNTEEEYQQTVPARFKKYNSQKFCPNIMDSIDDLNIKNMENLVEEITHEDNKEKTYQYCHNGDGKQKSQFVRNGLISRFGSQIIKNTDIWPIDKSYQSDLNKSPSQKSIEQFSKSMLIQPNGQDNTSIQQNRIVNPDLSAFPYLQTGIQNQKIDKNIGVDQFIKNSQKLNSKQPMQNIEFYSRDKLNQKQKSCNIGQELLKIKNQQRGDMGSDYLENGFKNPKGLGSFHNNKINEELQEENDLTNDPFFDN